MILKFERFVIAVVVIFAFDFFITHEVCLGAEDEGVYVETGGNVGIGTTTPSYLLQLLKDGSAAPIRLDIHNTGTDAADDSMLSFETEGLIEFGMGIDRSTGKFTVTKGNTFGTDDYFTIDSIGNIGIGTMVSGGLLGLKDDKIYLDVLETEVDSGVFHLTFTDAVTGTKTLAELAAVNTGPEGPQGIQGEIGPQGIQGLAGADGAQGPQGETGLTGPEGLQGPIGLRGPEGPIGLTGPEGPQGVQGEIGPQGIQGLAGADGAQGPQGETGLTGPEGLQGPIGLTGPEGPQGIQGEIGPQGIQGLAGADGVQGPQGETGPQGVQGDKGDQGIQGQAGTDGTSPILNVKQLFNQATGTLPKKSALFTTGGGTLLIIASGSGWTRTPGKIGMSIAVDGTIKGYANSYSNETYSHKAFTTNPLVVSGIAAGKHTITLAPLFGGLAPFGGTVTDVNDFFSVTVLEFAF